MSVFWLIILFFILLFFSVPIGIAMVIPSVIYIFQNPAIQLSIVAQRMMGGVDAFSLLAIPLFLLAGNIMNEGAITDRIFGFAHVLTRHVRGGLAYANVIASVLFAGMSGSACADAGSLGAIELKAMRDHNYEEDFSIAVTGASSIIGPIFPPSCPMILVAFASGLSLGKLFMAGVVPGLLMALVLCVFVFIKCNRNKAQYITEEKASLREIAVSLWKVLPCVMMPVLILAGIYSGYFTATETAAVMCAVSIILALCYHSLSWEAVVRIVKNTVDNMATISVIIMGATLFGYMLANEKIPDKLVNLFAENVDNIVVFWIIIIAAFLVMGCFLDDSVANLIIIPMLIPVAENFGIDPIHFVVVCVLLLMIGLLTPPVGLVLFVLQKVTTMPFEKIAKAVFPFLCALLIAVIILIVVPGISTFLPNVLFG